MKSPAQAPEIVVFDVGNVLIEWDPRHLYRKLLPDAAHVEQFLEQVCTTAWNEEQDRGRRWAEAVAERIALFPTHSDLIRAYDTRWMEMAPGPIAANVALLRLLRARGTPVYGLTNFSAEKWAACCERFDFLTEFDGVVVSADVGAIKPEPEIYRILFERYAIDPATAVFLDDRADNCAASEAAGMAAIQATPGRDLAAELRKRGVHI
ncbi:MAG: HAD family phosphatase [Neomegalonema sp.]|nr:HAD family phosphatase [Neomegalonema sp.]